LVIRLETTSKDTITSKSSAASAGSSWKRSIDCVPSAGVHKLGEEGDE
jgi:hypothetical protein